MQFVPGTSFGPYQIVSVLGAGGMGEVYRANDTRLGREVALKVVRQGPEWEDAAKRFRQEAVILARLSHANIAALYEFDHANGTDFLILELATGEPLSARLARGPLPEHETVKIADQIAAALEHAHERGIVHQDLKPGNVVVDEQGAVKILDFGLADVFSWAGDATTLMGAIRGAGTLHYMAPEQLRGEPANAQTDLYGLGVVMYEMLTGQRPFTGATAAMVSNSILHTAPVLPSQLAAGTSAVLDEAVRRCLAKASGDRFPSATALRNVLRELSATASRPAPSSLSSPIPLPSAVPSLVALPARVLGGDVDRFLADMVSNALSTSLGVVPGLRVQLSPTLTDVERVGGHEAAMRAYEVTWFLLASVIPQGARMTLNVQLVEKATQQVHWSRQMACTPATMPSKAKTAARAIATHLGCSPARIKSPSSSPTVASGDDLAFQNALFRGSVYNQRGHTGDFDLARTSLEPFGADPQRAALACAELARLYVNGMRRHIPAAVAEPLIRSWAGKALEADPKNGRAWAALSSAEALAPEGFRLQIEYALRAAALAPRDPAVHSTLSTALANFSHVFTGATCAYLGELDPLDATAALHEGLTHAYALRPGPALARIEHALSLDPESPAAVVAKSGALCLLGEYAAARDWVETRLRPLVDQRRAVPEWMQLFGGVAALGLAPLDTSLRDAMARMGRGEVKFPLWQTFTQGIAPALARAGHREAALAVLESRAAMALHEPYDFFLSHRYFEPLRADPRFQAAALQSRQGFLGMLGVLRQARARGEFPAYLNEPWNRYAGLAEAGIGDGAPRSSIE